MRQQHWDKLLYHCSDYYSLDSLNHCSKGTTYGFRVKTYFPAAGVITLEAYSEGNENYEPSDTVKNILVIVPASQTITWDQDLGTQIVGDSILLKATTSSGKRPQYVVTNGANLAKVNLYWYGHNYYYYLVCDSVGTATIEARHDGIANVYDAAKPISKTITIVKRPQIIRWSQEFSGIHIGDTVLLTALSTEKRVLIKNTGLSIEHTITQGSEYAEIKDGKLVCKAKGEVTIEARQYGDDKYEAAESVSKTIHINEAVAVRKQQSVTWEQSFDDVKVGDEIVLTAVASSGLSVEYIITKGSDYAEISNGSLICKAVGEVTIEARQSGNDEYEAAESVSRTVSMMEKDVTFPVTIDGLTYNYLDNDNTALQVYQCTAEIANIRAEVNGLPVTTLNQTFRKVSVVKEVNLPASIENLDFISFEENYNLKKIVVDEDNPILCDVDGVLYNKDKTTLLYYPAGKGTGYTVPEGTLTVSDHAFSGNKSITEVVLPEGLQRIESDAFQSCEGLTSFTFPSTINYLGYGVIRECKNMAEIHCMAASPANIQLGMNVFENIDKDKCILYVPKGAKALYEVVDQWKYFKHIVEENATGIVGAFANGISFVVKNRALTIMNAPANINVRIYTIAGELVYAGYETTVQLPDAGTCIIGVNGKTKTVLVS